MTVDFKYLIKNKVREPFLTGKIGELQVFNGNLLFTGKMLLFCL